MEYLSNKEEIKVLPIKEAAKTTQIPGNTIRSWLNKGYIRGIKDKVLKVCIDDLLDYQKTRKKKGVCNPFGIAFPRENESFKPLFTIKQGHIHFTKKKIMVGSLGTIWNITDNHIYGENAIDTNGHIQIRIDGTLYYPHKLVAMLWCPNRRYKVSA